MLATFKYLFRCLNFDDLRSYIKAFCFVSLLNQYGETASILIYFKSTSTQCSTSTTFNSMLFTVQQEESGHGVSGGNGQLITLGLGLLATALAASYVTKLAKVMHSEHIIIVTL